MYHQLRIRLKCLPLSELINEQTCVMGKSPYINPTNYNSSNSNNNNRLYFSTKRSNKTKKNPNKSNNKKRGGYNRHKSRSEDQSILSPLEQIKSKGLQQFEKMTDEVVSKSRKLLTDDNKDEDGEEMLSIAQLRKTEHIRRTLTSCIEKISRHESIFMIGNEPIDIMDVEVSSDLRYARVIWSLPFEINDIIASSEEDDDSKRQKIISEMKNILDTKGTARLQGLINISVKGRSPKLRFVHENSNKISRLKMTSFLAREDIDHELLKYL